MEIRNKCCTKLSFSYLQSKIGQYKVLKSSLYVFNENYIIHTLQSVVIHVAQKASGQRTGTSEGLVRAGNYVKAIKL